MNSYQRSNNNLSFDEGDVEYDSLSSSYLRKFHRWVDYKVSISRLVFVFLLCIGIGWRLGVTSGLVQQRQGVGSESNDFNMPNLVWSDEFDGDSLDLKKWTFVNGDGCDVGLCGWGKQEYRVWNRITTLLQQFY